MQTHRASRPHTIAFAGAPLIALALVCAVSIPLLGLAEAESRDIEIHDLEGHWYLLRLSVVEFSENTELLPPTKYERHELYKSGLDLRKQCREQLAGTELLLDQPAPVEDELWYHSRLRVLKSSLTRAVSDIEDRLQQLEPGPLLP